MFEKGRRKRKDGAFHHPIPQHLGLLSQMVPRENGIILTQGCRIAFLGQPVIGSRSLEAPGSFPAFHTARWPPSLLFLQAATHCQQPRAFCNPNSAFTSKFLTRLPGSGTKARLSVAGSLQPCDTPVLSQPVCDLNTPTDSWGCPSAATHPGLPPRQKWEAQKREGGKRDLSCILTASPNQKGEVTSPHAIIGSLRRSTPALTKPCT